MGVWELLENHVELEIESLDRLYLNGYLANMQHSGGLVRFLQGRGAMIPSPAILRDITAQYRKDVDRYAEDNSIEIIKLEKGQRKDDVMKSYLKKFSDEHGVLFIGKAQEKTRSFKGRKKQGSGPMVGFDYSRETVNVLHYYFYVLDREFGPAFIKVCTYAPYPLKVILNGHEWAKQQMQKQNLPFEALDNGFLSCEDPVAAQGICDQLTEAQIEQFLQRWVAELPLPINNGDRERGFDYKLSIWQMEVSLTQVFDRPLRGRQFFEDVIRDNLDLGRPDRVQLVFGKKLYKNTPSRYRTRVIQRGVQPSIQFEYKKTQVKQYFKEERALRTETTFNDTKDFGVGKSLSNLDHLQRIGRNINRRLLDVQRASHNCVLSGESLDRVFRPTIKDGKPAPGFRFGDDRSNSVFQGLTLHAHLADGFTNESLRSIVAALLGAEWGDYHSRRMSYDLRKLRWKGMILKRKGTRRYEVTPYGLKFSMFMTKLNCRIFRQVAASMEREGPVQGPYGPIFRKLDRIMDSHLEWASLGLEPIN